MNEELYLLDNNVLSHLSRLQRASEFFFTRCHVPTEVLHEAEIYPDVAAFKQIEYPTTARVLELLAQVMTTVPDSDTSLVNLYTNKGAADPMLVACALHAMEDALEHLWGPTWVIVSNDKAVLAKAAEFGVESCTREAFLLRTEGAWED